MNSLRKHTKLTGHKGIIQQSFGVGNAQDFRDSRAVNPQGGKAFLLSVAQVKRATPRRTQCVDLWKEERGIIERIYTAKLSPQAQVRLAFGLWNSKPFPFNPSE